MSNETDPTATTPVAPGIEDTVATPDQAKSTTVADSANSVDTLRREAEEALKHVNRLKTQRQSLLQSVERLETEVREAEAKADKAVRRFREVQPSPPLPPVPSFDQCKAMARAQRPDANDHETVRLAAQLHATMSDGLARSGDAAIYNRPLPEIEGPEVQKVGDHHYELDAPPKDAKPGQHRGTVKRYG